MTLRDDDSTPITAPGRGDNGVSYSRAGSISGEIPSAEDTGPIRPLLAESIEGGGARAFAQLLASELGGGGGGVPPDVHVKKIKRHNWATLTGIVATMVTGYFAIDHRSKTNEDTNTRQTVEINEHDAAIKDNAKNIATMRYKIDEVVETVDEAREGQREIVEGLGQLKRENLRDKDRRIERQAEEIRRLRRERRR